MGINFTVKFYVFVDKIVLFFTVLRTYCGRMESGYNGSSEKTQCEFVRQGLIHQFFFIDVNISLNI